MSSNAVQLLNISLSTSGNSDKYTFSKLVQFLNNLEVCELLKSQLLRLAFFKEVQLPNIQSQVSGDTSQPTIGVISSSAEQPVNARDRFITFDVSQFPIAVKSVNCLHQ